MRINFLLRKYFCLNNLDLFHSFCHSLFSVLIRSFICLFIHSRLHFIYTFTQWLCHYSAEWLPHSFTRNCCAARAWMCVVASTGAATQPSRAATSQLTGSAISTSSRSLFGKWETTTFRIIGFFIKYFKYFNATCNIRSILSSMLMHYLQLGLKCLFYYSCYLFTNWNYWVVRY